MLDVLAPEDNEEVGDSDTDPLNEIEALVDSEIDLVAEVDEL